VTVDSGKRIELSNCCIRSNMLQLLRAFFDHLQIATPYSVLKYSSAGLEAGMKYSSSTSHAILHMRSIHCLQNSCPGGISS
jgi:hypothetical protein